MPSLKVTALQNPQTLTASSKICFFNHSRSCNVFTAFVWFQDKTENSTIVITLFLSQAAFFFEFKTRHSNINPRYCIEWWSFHFSSGVLLYFFLCNFKLTWPILSILQKNLRKIFKIPQILLLIKTTKSKCFCLKWNSF